jgi:proteasome lid subunit RPN8/RPN11
MDSVRLPRSLANELRRLASESPDEEICGLISGVRGELHRRYPIPNVARDRRRFFEMDPKGQIEAMRRMREADEDLIAIYHSHPGSPAYPSPTDVRQHGYPEALYLIIATAPHQAPEIRGFRIRDGKIEEVAVQPS